MTSHTPTIGVLIPSSGSGTRFGSHIPKQFLPLQGKTSVLEFTLLRVIEALGNIPLVVVLSKEYCSEWEPRLKGISPSIQVVEGGEERFHSVKAGLDAMPQVDHVLIHDSVRPLCSMLLWRRAASMGNHNTGWIPTIPLINSIREITTADTTVARDRSCFLQVQTPQVFPLAKLKQAYAQDFQSYFTDDASVFESHHGAISCFPGDEENIKITHAQDLTYVQWKIQQQRDTTNDN